MTTTWTGYDRGDREFRRIRFALFFAGFATFALIFGPQGVLTAAAEEFSLPSSTAALLVSATSLGVAFSVIPWSIVADRIGRTSAMKWSLSASVVIATLTPFIEPFAGLVIARALLGVTLGAVPGVAVAYLAEELVAHRVAPAAGIFVAGNTFGGIVARISAGVAAEHGGVSLALAVLDALAVAAALGFLIVVPPPRGFTAMAVQPYSLGTRLGLHLRDPMMLSLFTVGFLAMGCFGVVYNLLGFRLIAPPLSVPATVVSLVFTAYLVGTITSRFSGQLVVRFGPLRVIVAGVCTMSVGLVLMIPLNVGVVLAGLVVFTFGMFLVYPTCSGLVGQRALIGRAQGTALFQLSWLSGSSVMGWLGGIFFDSFGWVVTMILAVLACLIAGIVAALGLLVFADRRPTVPPPRVTS